VVFNSCLIFSSGPLSACLSRVFLALFKGVRHVLQKDQAKHYVLVVRSVQIGSELVSGFPEFVVQGFEKLLFRVVYGFSLGRFGNAVWLEYTPARQSCGAAKGKVKNVSLGA
jgi:hypothetical protein